MIDAARISSLSLPGTRWAQWALGSDWAAAERLQPDTPLVPPPATARDVRAEVVIESPTAFTVLGAAQPRAADPSPWLEGLAGALDDPWARLHPCGVYGILDRLTLGVFNQWLESPRVELTTAGGSRESIVKAITVASPEFATETPRPIIAEFWTERVDAWIAVGVSRRTPRGQVIDTSSTRRARARVGWVDPATPSTP
ncbi:MAG: hypothetical protein RIB32_01930 [Phycisphaerales bacterium]